MARARLPLHIPEQLEETHKRDGRWFDDLYRRDGGQIYYDQRKERSGCRR